MNVLNANDSGATSLAALNAKFTSLDSSIASTSTSLATLATSVGALVFNVKSYGALGNGSHDDSAAIQSAINAANTAGGGTVVFEPGVYIIGTTLTTHNNIKMIGLGGYGMAISAYGSATVILRAKTNLNTAIINLGNYVGLEFSDIEFDGNGSNQAVAAPIIDGTGFDGSYMMHTWNRCTFSNGKATKYAVTYQSVAGGGHISAFAKFNECVWRNNLGGALGATNVVWMQFFKCHVYDNINASGVFTFINASCYISSCDFENNTGTMVACVAGSDVNSNVVIINNDFETPNAYIAIYCQDYVLHPTISGNQILTHGGNGIIVNNCRLFNISNNCIQSSTVGGNGIEIDPACLNFSIVGNTISANYSYEIIVSAGASDYYVIVGNALGGGSVTDGGTGTHKSIANNV